MDTTKTIEAIGRDEALAELKKLKIGCHDSPIYDYSLLGISVDTPTITIALALTRDAKAFH